LKKIGEEKDLGLGVYVDQNFKLEKPCTKAASKGNQILGMISITFLQRVQRRATRMMMEGAEMNYESRVRKVGLTTL